VLTLRYQQAVPLLPPFYLLAFFACCTSSLAAGLVFNFHVQVKRALRAVGLIAAEVWALMRLLYLVVAAAEVSLAATGI
jgi:hypothetical protein